MSIKKTIAAVAATALFPLAAQAAPLTYNVVQPFQDFGSLTGTITTNGDFGVLTASDITSWSLTLTIGSSSVTLTTDSSQVGLFGSELNADIDSIDFNFSGATNSYLLFQAPDLTSTATSFWCVQTTGCYSDFSSQRIEIPGANLTTSFITGVRAIATRAAVTPVPEPASLALVGIGLAGLAASRRRRH